MKNRVKGHRRGCKPCNLTLAWAQRRATPPADEQARWQAAFQALVDFADREQHARVPVSHVTADGFALGEWVNRQRDVRARMSAVRTQALDALPGWSWAVKQDRWEAGFAALKRYVEREHHALVPHAHLEDDYTLGLFVAKQRQRYWRGELSGKRVSRLEAVPGWKWRVRAPRGSRTSSGSQPSE